MGGMEKILNAADLISEVRKTFARLEGLETSIKDLADATVRLDTRLREVEAGLREAKAEICLEAVKETQGIVNSVQAAVFSQIMDTNLKLQSLSDRGLLPVGSDKIRKKRIPGGTDF
jgi:hypothetical protein